MQEKPSENQTYRRIKLLGQGAFGKVFLVECLASKVLYVLKQIDLNDLTEEQKKSSFQESTILKTLKHPNIITFHDVYKTTKGRLCIVMDYADGGDLANKIEEAKKDNKNYSEPQILDWFTQICLALKHVHDRKIIHRDLKSSNIFLTKDNRVKLGDFGVAFELSHTSDRAKTCIGTPYYLSPEIIDNKPYNHKTDIWSLGVILYEMCALTQPFNATSLAHLALNIVRGNYAPLPTIYSKDIKNLVGQLLSRDSGKRPSVNEILKFPIITNRIKNFLTESLRKDEFSHTILHSGQSNPSIFSQKKPPVPKMPLPPSKKPLTAKKKPNSEVNSKPNPSPKPTLNPNPNPKPNHNSKQKDVKDLKKDQKLKKIVLVQERREEEERKKKVDKDKEREEERLMMKKDIKKKRNQKNGGFQIEWISKIKEEDAEEAGEEEGEEICKVDNFFRMEPKDKGNGSKECVLKTNKKEKKVEEKWESEKVDKKSRPTRESLLQMKKNLPKNRDKEIPVEIFLPNKNPSPKKDQVPCVQIELEKAEKRLEEKKRLLEYNDNEKISFKFNPEQAQILNYFENLDEEMFLENKIEKSQLIVKNPLYEKLENSTQSTEFPSKMTEIEAVVKNNPSDNDDDVEKMIQELSNLISDLNNLKKEKDDLVEEEERGGGRRREEEVKEGEDEGMDEGEEEGEEKELEAGGKEEEEGGEEREKGEEEEEIEREDDPNDFDEYGGDQKKISFPSLEDSQTMNILAEKNRVTKINNLKILIIEALGEKNFQMSYDIVKREFLDKDLDNFDELHGSDNYKSLLPFLDEEIILKYLPLLITYVIMETN